jgi:hypothetical protein
MFNFQERYQWKATNCDCQWDTTEWYPESIHHGEEGEMGNATKTKRKIKGGTTQSNCIGAEKTYCEWVK